MLHLRIIAPESLSGGIVGLLEACRAVTHVSVLPGVARSPHGDVIECDVVREGADALLKELKRRGIGEKGSVTAQNVDIYLSEATDHAERRTPGLGVDALVWGEMEHKAGEETELSATYLVFLTVATIIAAVGVLLDEPILIAGAMVVGPEFGPLAALCVGVLGFDLRVIRRSVLALVVGFPIAMVATVVATWALTAMGLLNRSMLLEPRPLTEFIWRPDGLSFVVAFLAGIAGMLSLTTTKSGALVGVLISVTTVPAAANAAVAVAYGVGDEAVGSARQLLINMAAIVTSGVLTLLVQRWVSAWRQRSGDSHDSLTGGPATPPAR